MLVLVLVLENVFCPARFSDAGFDSRYRLPDVASRSFRRRAKSGSPPGLGYATPGSLSSTSTISMRLVSTLQPATRMQFGPGAVLQHFANPTPLSSTRMSTSTRTILMRLVRRISPAVLLCRPPPRSVVAERSRSGQIRNPNGSDFHSLRTRNR